MKKVLAAVVAISMLGTTVLVAGENLIRYFNGVESMVRVDGEDWLVRCEDGEMHDIDIADFVSSPVCSTSVETNQEGQSASML